MVHRCHQRAFWLRLVYEVLQSLLPLGGILVLKSLIDNIGDIHLTTLYALLFVGIFFLNRVVASLALVNKDVLSQRLIDYVSDCIQQQSVSLDMSYYDNPAFHDTFHRAQQESAYRPLEVLNLFMMLFGAMVTLTGVLVILGTTSPLVVALMVVAILPSFFVRLIKARRIYNFRRNNTQIYRRTAYYSALLTHRDFAKEVRLFGLAIYFRRLFVDIRHNLVSRLLVISRRLATYDSLCAIIETAALLFVLLLFVRQAYSGAITVGAFVMLFETFRKGQSSLQNLVQSIVGLYDSRLFAGNLFEFLSLKPNISSPEEVTPFPKRVDKVAFIDVTFRYPNMEYDVLSHYNLVAERGSICRIEGENGYGKSTLMKLLMRLYDPTDGVVQINGIDIRLFNVNVLRENISVLFQDFVRYNFSAAENIAFGRMSVPIDQKRIEWAARQAAIDKTLENLPKGYENMLGRVFANGEELSMGQWQRVALARLFYSDAPIVIFDEPTAWMDRTTRNHFHTIVKEMQKEKIIFLIQHI